MSYMFDSDPPPEEPDEDEQPYDQVGDVGSMPFYAKYDWDHIVRQCDRLRTVIERRGEVDTETLLKGVELPRSGKIYHPDQLDSETKDTHTRRYFRKHLRHVLTTADDVDSRGGWDVDLDSVPETDAEFREAASDLGIPGTDRTRNYPGIIEAYEEHLRELAEGRDGRPVFHDEVLTFRPFERDARVDCDEATLEGALEYAAKLPWLDPPVNHDRLSWTADTPEWAHADAKDAEDTADADSEEVAHA